MCGVIGVLSVATDVFPDAVAGLFQMQHRGQDACGISISDGERIRQHKNLGLVREVFADRPTDDFVGRIAIGHVRYPTQGGNRLSNTQPHLVTTLQGALFSLSSNGDLTNYWNIRAELEEQGVDFAGTNDAELLLKYIAWQHLTNGMPLLQAIRTMQQNIHGAYSCILLTRDRMFAIRDPHGIRPMSWGAGDQSWMVASETNALDISKHIYQGEIEPGAIVEFTMDGPIQHPHPNIQALRPKIKTAAHCSFEHIYFSRPDSRSFGTHVYEMRKRFGAWLADQEDKKADVVVPVPDSSNAVALGYSQRSGVPFEFGLIRNHYVGRTFIAPTQGGRDTGVKSKFNPQRSVLEGRRVILVDDSIVRGTTLRKITRMVRAAGASEVHIRIGSPITRFSCFYGVDTPSHEELIGNRMNSDQIRDHLTADSIRYMSVDGLRDCLGRDREWCMACFDGSYPVPLTERKQAL